MNRIHSHLTLKMVLSVLVSGLAGSALWAQTPKPATPGSAVVPSKPAAPAAQSPEPGGKVVLKVGNRQFTKADIDILIASLSPQLQHSIASEGKKALGDQYAMLVALSEQAEAQHLDQSAEFIHKLAFQKQQLEAQEAFEVLNNQATVTPEDVQQYFNAHTDDYDEIAVRQIIVRKKTVEAGSDPAHPSTPTGPGLSPEEAKTRAEAIRKELLAGTDIKKVTDDFKAPGDVLIDTEPRTIRHGGMRPDMEKVAFALKDGEVSEPIDVPQALVLFQVVKHSHSELKDVSPEIEKKLRQEKVQATMDGVKKNANIWMDEEYFGPGERPELAPTLGEPAAPPQPKQ